MPRVHPSRLTSSVCWLALIAITVSADAQQLQPVNRGQAGPQQLSGSWLSRRLPWSTDKTRQPNRSTRVRSSRQGSRGQQADGQFAVARLAERRGQPEVARQIYESLMRTYPERHAAFHRLGVMTAKQGNAKLAAELMLHARQLEPGDPEVLRDLGYLYYLNGRLDDATKLYRAGLKLQPGHEGLTNNYAMLLAEQEKYKQSLELFKRVNTPAEAHANLGFLLTQMGQLASAEEQFSHALSLDKSLNTAAHGLVEASRLKEKVARLRDQDLKRAAVASSPVKSNAPVSVASQRDISLSGDHRDSPLANGAPPPNLQQSTAARGVRHPKAGSESSVSVQRAVRLQAVKTTSTPGPFRQRSALRVTSTRHPAPSLSEADRAAAENPRVVVESPVVHSPTVLSASGDWSMRRFATSKPTWTPDGPLPPPVVIP